MKKKLSIILAFVLALCISIPVFAEPSKYPTDGSPAAAESNFKIQKKYVKSDETLPLDKFPDETLKFKSECTAAPMEIADAPKLTVKDLTVSAVENDITVIVPAYSVPGKYNYKITEQSPSVHTPGSKDTAGVVYDKEPVWIQVVVKYTKDKNEAVSTLKKFVTVAADGNTVGAETDASNDATKKADFKNKYLLDGEVDPNNPDPPKPEPEDPDKPTPDPNPVPSPTPIPQDPNPDPIPTPKPEPGEEDKPDVAKAKFKIMKHVRGPLASRDKEFTVHVTLESKKPVRSDITYNDGQPGTIYKVGGTEPAWTGNDTNGYTAKVTLQIKDGETVTFKDVPAGVEYTVQEDASHIGGLTEGNVNNPAEGYTVSYYGGGTKLDNPTNADASTKEYGKKLSATGMVGYDTNNNIVISNSKGLNDEDSAMVKPNTGISLDSLPYIIILCLVIAGAGVMIVKSRKRGEE